MTRGQLHLKTCAGALLARQHDCTMGLESKNDVRELKNHQDVLKIMRLKLGSTGERPYIFLRLLCRLLLVHGVTVKQRI